MMAHDLKKLLSVLNVCRHSRTAFFIAMGLLLPPMVIGQMKSRPRTVSLCELIAHSSLYVGQEVTTTARISFFKHGTALWDQDCRGLGADIYSEDNEHQSQSVRELTRLVRQGGFGDHPVIATLTGIWLGRISSEQPSFLPQPRIVFKVISASDVSRSKHVERPYFASTGTKTPY